MIPVLLFSSGTYSTNSIKSAIISEYVLSVIFRCSYLLHAICYCNNLSGDAYMVWQIGRACSTEKSAKHVFMEQICVAGRGRSAELSEVDRRHCGFLVDFFPMQI